MSDISLPRSSVIEDESANKSDSERITKEEYEQVSVYSRDLYNVQIVKIYNYYYYVKFNTD